MRRFFVFLAVLILLGGLSGGLYYFQFFFKPAMIKGFIAKAVPPPAVVAVEAAKTESWVPHLPAIGTFNAVRGIDVASQASGIVRTVEIGSGKDVPRGDPLLEIDDSVEQADLKAGLATLKNTGLALERQKQLAATGNGTQVSLDTAQATRDSASATVERTRALIAQKAIVAPFAGRLGLRKTEPGQFVAAGTSLVTLTQLDPIFADFPVPEQDIEKIKLGQTVEIKTDAMPGKVFEGRIGSIDTRVNPETRNVIVRAQVPNPQLDLLPGMFANIEVLYGQPVQVITLPRTGVTFSLYGDSIFVIKPASDAPAAAGQVPAGEAPLIAERRFVRTGETRRDRVAITQGLAEGERVVTQGQLKLQPNSPVRIDASATLQAPAQLPKQ